VSWQLGLARIAALIGGDLQRAARAAGGGEALWRAGHDGLGRLLRVDAPVLAQVIAIRRSFDAEAELARLAAEGIRHVPCGHADYPGALDELPDPPFGVFTSGRPLCATLGATAPVVAIVGSRRGTAFGLRFARRLAEELGRRGAVVVSGLALGVDAEAHDGALAAGAATVAVVGSGVDVPSPRRNHLLRERMLAAGTVLSEYWPGTAPAPWRFPARNRIIAGLADAVVVVEAGERSGALITADFGLELGRPVLAVPGAPGAAASVGCNALLRAGAGMCEAAADVVAELPHLPWQQDRMALPPAPDGLDARIYELLVREPLLTDELAARLGDAGTAAVIASLARLELAGLVVRGQAQRFWAAPLRGAA
jgi:DNA processing protein